MTDPELADDIGNLLRALRYSADLTQHELATTMGSTRTAVATAEGGRHDVSLARLFAVARVCGFDIDITLRRGRQQYRVTRPGSP